MTPSENTNMAKWMAGQLTDAEFEALEGSANLGVLKALSEKMSKADLPALDLEASYTAFKSMQKPATKSIKIRQLVAFIAAAIVGFAITFGLMFFGQRTKIKAALSQTTVEHQLPDFSIVRLNDGSNITYQPRQWNKKRSIYLEGEALFDVRKGTTFTVETSNGNVVVLGTIFNIRAWDDAFEVQCTEGRVSVQSGGQELVLNPYEKAVLKDNRLLKSTESNDIAWLSGQSKFEDTDINFVFKELQRQYDIAIIGLPLQARSFNGIFEHGSLSNAAAQICKPMGLQYAFSQDSSSLQIFE